MTCGDLERKHTKTSRCGEEVIGLLSESHSPRSDPSTHVKSGMWKQAPVPQHSYSKTGGRQKSHSEAHGQAEAGHTAQQQQQRDPASADSLKLPSDLHMHPEACVHAHSHTEQQLKSNSEQCVE